MGKLWSNRIVRGLGLFLIAYWSIGLTVPGAWWSASLAGMLLVTSAIMLVSYAPAAYEVVKSGEIGDDRLSLLGLFLLAAGAVYNGIFGLLWTIAGSPMDWLQTATSTFSRGLFIAGFVLLTLSPGVTKEGIRFPAWGRMFLAFLAVAVIAFLFGFNFQNSEAAMREAPHLLTAYDCKASEPVKGNITRDGRMLYHRPIDAAYRSTVPERCFRSERAAQVAGFVKAP